ncbi:S24 family peptidase [Apilactobacillus xinyiensis]|uniref:S24 family peptidase n=1 Tax=Apilactobacillus xinyiensis TaxID=2841032 RepID=UPI001C7CBF48|nr:S24 family peptidase [Apilactobacillus xinyiensis]
MNSTEKDSIIGMNFNYCLAELCKTIPEVAKDLGVPEIQLHYLMCGIVKDRSIVDKIINYFQADKETFSFIKRRMSTKGFAYVPIMNKLEYGKNARVIININGYLPMKDDEKSYQFNNNPYFIQSTDNSMDPIISKESMVLVEYDSDKDYIDSPNGSIVIALVNGKLYIRRLYHVSGKAILKSDNKKYKDIVLNKEKYELFGIANKVINDL